MAALAEANEVAAGTAKSIFEGKDAPSVAGVVASGEDTFSDAKPSDIEVAKIGELRVTLKEELGG